MTEQFEKSSQIHKSAERKTTDLIDIDALALRTLPGKNKYKYNYSRVPVKTSFFEGKSRFKTSKRRLKVEKIVFLKKFYYFKMIFR